MKVKLLCKLTTGPAKARKIYQPGDIVEVSDAIGKQLLEQRDATKKLKDKDDDDEDEDTGKGKGKGKGKK